MFSKQAQSVKKAAAQQLLKQVVFGQNKSALVAAQKRFLQSQYKPGSPVTFVDAMSGIYEDPLYALDCKPLEWRDEQTISWTSLGSLLAVGMCRICRCLVGEFCELEKF